LYRATVRGVADEIVLVGDRTASGHPMHGDHVGQSSLTDARPLTVLDLTEDDARHLVDYLQIAVEEHPDQLGRVGRAVFTAVADQIEAQTKPPKPAEPAETEYLRGYRDALTECVADAKANPLFRNGVES